MHRKCIVTSQNLAAPGASPDAKPNQPATRTTPPRAAAHPTPPPGGPDTTCVVHRLEEALLLVEAMQLTSDQKMKISQLTKVQTARCTEAKKQHKATHEQILALLTPEQHQKLQTESAGLEHCHKNSHSALEEHTVRA